MTATVPLHSMLVLCCAAGEQKCLVWLGTRGSRADCITATAHNNVLTLS